MDSKIADLVELGKVGNAIKVVLNEHLVEVYHEQLEVRRRKHADNIKHICNENYTQFIGAIDDLMDVTKTVMKLKEDLTGLNKSVQGSGAQLEDQIRKLQQQRHKRRHIELALQQVQRCQHTVHLVQKVHDHIADMKFINALKIINQLQHHHLPAIANLEFGQYISNQLPTLRAKIQKSVLMNFDNWLHRVSSQCGELGACAMMQVLRSLKHSETGNLRLKETDETLYNKVENIDFGLVYQCLHVYETLEIDTFAKDYKERRMKACKNVTNMPLFQLKNNKVTGYDDYFFNVTGFFILEQAISHRYHQLMTQNIMQEEWDDAIIIIRQNLNAAFRTISDPDVLVEIKTCCILMCKALEMCGLRVATLYAYLNKELELFCQQLGKGLAQKVRYLQNSDVWNNNWMVPDRETYEAYVMRFKLVNTQEQDQIPTRFPHEVKFSETVPKICEEVVTFLESVKRYCENLPDLDPSNWVQELDKAFIKYVIEVIEEETFQKNSQRLKMSQLAQIHINIIFLEFSCTFFEEYIAHDKADPNAPIRAIIPLTKTHDKLANFDGQCTDQLFTELDEQIEQLLTTLDEFDYAPSKPFQGVRDWVLDLLNFLQMTLSVKLRNIKHEILVAIHFTACRKISSGIIARITSPNVKKINLNGIYNLHLDLQEIENWSKSTGEDSLDQSFVELRQLLDIFLSNDLAHYADDAVRNRYRYVNNSSLRKLLSKYKQIGRVFGKGPSGYSDFSSKQIKVALALSKQ